VRDLPKSQFGVDIEHDFEPKYITIRGKGDIIKELRSAAKAADKVLLASDPDREGEAIAWHLQKLLALGDCDSCRIEFNEITKPAIQNAVKHPRMIDEPRVDAQQARRVLDRLVGYNLSPLLWRKVRKGLSAGRVQSVAVRIIVEREEEIREFKPVEYWTLTAFFSHERGQFSAKLVKHDGKKVEISTKAQMDQVLSDLTNAKFSIAEINKKEKKRYPSAPFTTSSLQQEAYRKLNFTARKTMMVAQQLYEGLDLGKELGTVGLVTYIRTDSTRISEVAVEEARELIKAKYGPDYYPAQARILQSKGRIQNAHEAIRPTYVQIMPEAIKEKLSRDQFKLYKLIWDRFVASQMSAAILDITTVNIAAGAYTFRTTGSLVRFPGFMKVYIEGIDEGGQEDNTELLPDLGESTELTRQKLEPKQHFTEPPPRFTEASLVKRMEEVGIGRPSTYAPTIETIHARGYVVREDKHLYPTELGEIVVDLLLKHFPNIIDTDFTAGMEKQLDAIEEGGLRWKEVIRDFYANFKPTLDKAEEEIGQVEIEDEVTDQPCELCGRLMVKKIGRFGKFLACPGFPDCRNTKPLLEEIGVACPKCGAPVVARRSKKGRKFFGCSSYPECDYISWERPAGKDCPDCGQPMVIKFAKKGNKIVCTNKDCRHEELAVNAGTTKEDVLATGTYQDSLN
ncbi:MAG: type I DNA topoisomerase, partial [Peptococcaceae bacterium]|nr:type I DNA topoisomerase [Peptococcaceae bacterium]